MRYKVEILRETYTPSPRWVVGSNPIWDSNYSKYTFLPEFTLISCSCCFSVSIWNIVHKIINDSLMKFRAEHVGGSLRWPFVPPLHPTHGKNVLLVKRTPGMNEIRTSGAFLWGDLDQDFIYQTVFDYFLFVWQCNPRIHDRNAQLLTLLCDILPGRLYSNSLFVIHSKY